MNEAVAKHLEKPAAPPGGEHGSPRHRALIALAASYNAALVIEKYSRPFMVSGDSKPVGQDVNALLNVLNETMDIVVDGNMKGCEGMLIGQARALQAIFVNLACLAKGQDQMPQIEGLLRMALKAQNQSRMTLETLANIKNPPIVFAKQANISAGHQQVNNGPPPCARAGKTEIGQNKLLEHLDGQRLDTGTASASGRVDKAMEAVGEVHRPARRRRKG